MAAGDCARSVSYITDWATNFSFERGVSVPNAFRQASFFNLERSLRFRFVIKEKGDDRIGMGVNRFLGERIDPMNAFHFGRKHKESLAYRD